MVEEFKIKLGDEIRDEVTGLKGIATTRIMFLNGCIQYSITPRLKKGEKPNFEADISIDDHNLIVVRKNVVKSSEYPRKVVVRKSTGGPNMIIMKKGGKTNVRRRT